MVIRLCFGGRGHGGCIAYARCHAARAKLTAPFTLNMLAAAACAHVAAQQGAAGKRTETWKATITL